MPRLSRYAASLIALLLAFGLLAACGGDGDAEPTVTLEPTEAATEEPGETPESTDEPADEPVTLPFESFHYTVDLTFAVNSPDGADQPVISAAVEGDYVGPDSHAFTNRFDFAGLSGTQEVVIIGRDAWFREGSGEWRATSISDPDVASAIDLSSADPGFLYDPEFIEDFAALDSEQETIEGVSTRRYHIPRESIEALSALLGEEFLEDSEGLEEFEFTVWLEEETGALVRAELAATVSPDFFGTSPPFEIESGATVSITMMVDLTQIDDPGISIEAPI